MSTSETITPSDIESRLWRIESLAALGERAAAVIVADADADTGDAVYLLQHQFEIISEVAERLAAEIEKQGRLRRAAA